MAKVCNTGSYSLNKLNPEESINNTSDFIFIFFRKQIGFIKNPYNWNGGKAWSLNRLEVREKYTNSVKEVSTFAELELFIRHVKSFGGKKSNQQEKGSWKDMSKNNNYFNDTPNCHTLIVNGLLTENPFWVEQGLCNNTKYDDAVNHASQRTECRPHIKIIFEELSISKNKAAHDRMHHSKYNKKVLHLLGSFLTREHYEHGYPHTKLYI